MDPATKRKWKDLYRETKKGFTTAGLITVGGTGIAELAYDIVKSKIKANAYRVAAVAVAGPFIQTMGLPLYIFKIASTTTRIGLGIIQFGGYILKGQYTVANFAWAPVDFIVFGEWVDPTENQTLCIAGNETLNEILALTEQIIGDKSIID
jgi:hypothetical protein